MQSILCMISILQIIKLYYKTGPLHIQGMEDQSELHHIILQLNQWHEPLPIIQS